MTSLPELDLRLPIVVAPMAGGPTTVDLVRDVHRAGGWGLLAAANKTVEVMASEVDALRDAGIPVGVNVFVPDHPTSDADALATLRARLEPLAEQLDATLGEPVWDDDAYPAKIDWLLAHPVDVVTFTFGLPEADLVARLHEVGASIGVTVTSLADARAAADRGADFLTVQGIDAGGHQSLFDLSDEPPQGELIPRVREICRELELPVLASGGIATPQDVTAVLDAGAVAAQVGTAFLRSSSAGSSATHRAALASDDFTTTVLTRAYSGRYARGLANEFAARFDADAPAAYPEVNRLTGPLRKAAAASGEARWTHLWAGTGWRRTRDAAPAGLLDGEAGAIARWLAGKA